MMQLQKTVDQSSIDPRLLELIKLRSSQINGCAYCLDMHSKDAIAIGENPQRIYVLDAWREAPFYSPKEKAALAWCEALTLISDTAAPDSVYDELSKYFNEKEIMEITFAIITINSWNRLAISFRKVPGTYQSAKH